MSPATSKPRRENRKFRSDVVLLLVFMIAGMFHATRRSAHEFVGAAVIPLLTFHLWSNRDWLVEVMAGRPRGLSAEARFNRRWNVLQLFVSVVALSSGLVASEYLLPALGVGRLGGHFAGGLHATFATVLIGMVGVHLGLHGHWIGSRLRPAAGDPRRARRWWLALGILLFALVVGMAGWAPRLDSLRHYRSTIVRWRNDFYLVGGSVAAIGALTFGVLVYFRRRRTA